MFRDHRTAGAWFPKTMYITRFQESGYMPLADFDEDVDVTTGSTRGVKLSGDSLATWKEAPLRPADAATIRAHQRALARLEQSHSRRRHHEARQARVVHRIAERRSDRVVGRQPKLGDLPLARPHRREARPPRAGARYDSKSRQHEEGRQGEAARQET